MKKKPKRYEINTFEKLINIVNKDNFEGLSTDFLLWLHYTMVTIEALKEKDPEGCKGKTNWEIMQSIFIWVDDGKRGISSLQVKDKATGQIHEIKINKRAAGQTGA